MKSFFEKALFVLIFMTMSLGSLPAWATDSPATLTFMNFLDAGSIHEEIIQAWTNDLEKHFPGRIKIDFMSKDSGISAPQTYNAVSSGYADIGFTTLAYTRSRFPLMEFINLPIGFPSGVVNTAILNEVFDKFEPKELDKIKVLYLMAPGPFYYHTVGFSVRGIDDLHGKRVHYLGGADREVAQQGMVPVSLPMTKLVSALEDGTIQAGQWDFSASLHWHLAEFVDYDILCDSVAQSAGLLVFMNKKTWDSLDPDIQQYFERNAPHWASLHGQGWDKSAARGLAYSKQQGNKIVTISAEEGVKWRNAMQPVIDAYIVKTEALGLPGREVIEFVEGRLTHIKNGEFKSKYIH